MGAYIGGILGLYWDNGKIMEITIGFRALGLGLLFGDTMVPILPQEWRIKWKRKWTMTWKMKWKLGLYRGYITYLPWEWKDHGNYYRV